MVFLSFFCFDFMQNGTGRLGVTFANWKRNLDAAFCFGLYVSWLKIKTLARLSYFWRLLKKPLPKMNFGDKFSSFFDKGKTFRPKKKFQPGTLKYSLHKQAQASLNSGINLRTVSSNLKYVTEFRIISYWILIFQLGCAITPWRGF